MSLNSFERDFLNRKINATWEEEKVKGDPVRTSGGENDPDPEALNSVHEHRVVYAALQLSLLEVRRLREYIIESLDKNNISISPSEMEPELAQAINSIGMGGRPLDISLYTLVMEDAIRSIHNAVNAKVQDGSIDISTAKDGISGIIDNNKLSLDPTLLSAADVIQRHYLVAASKKGTQYAHMLNILYNTEVVVANTLSSMEEAVRGPNSVDLFDDIDVTRGSLESIVPKESSIAKIKKQSANSSQTHEDGRRKTIWKKHISDYLDDCVPCKQRFKASGQWLESLKKLQFGRELRIRVLSYTLGILSSLKLQLGEYYFSRNICSMIRLLQTSVCIPDFIAIVSLLKTLESKFDINQFKLGDVEFGGFVNLSKLIIHPILQYLYTLMTSAISQVLSPVQCIVHYLGIELSKLSAATAYTEEKMSPLLRKTMDPAGTLRDYLDDGYKYIMDTFTTIEQDLYKQIIAWSAVTFDDILKIQHKTNIQHYIGLLNDVSQAILSGAVKLGADVKGVRNDFCANVFQNLSPILMAADIKKRVKDPETQRALMQNLTSEDTTIGIVNADTSRIFNGFDVGDALDDPTLRKIIEDPPTPLIGRDPMERVGAILANPTDPLKELPKNIDDRAMFKILFGDEPVLMDSTFFKQYKQIKEQTLALNKFIKDNNLYEVLDIPKNASVIIGADVKNC